MQPHTLHTMSSMWGTTILVCVAHIATINASSRLGKGDHSVDEGVKPVIAGLVRTGGSLMMFANRVDQSFLRLQQGKESPETVEWDFYNRKALVRLPIQQSEATPATVEFRLAAHGSVWKGICASLARIKRHASKTQRP